LNTYVVNNRTNPRATIVIYSDIFGLFLPNNKLIADSYAKSGEYLVYLSPTIPADEKKLGTFSKYTGLLLAISTFLSWRSKHSETRTRQICSDFSPSCGGKHQRPSRSE
jgi:hypothetical protein